MRAGASGGSNRYPDPHESEVNFEALYRGGWFVDDVKAGELDKPRVIEARKLEMDFFKQMGVYRKIPRAAVPAGQKVITTKWVDTNKGSVDEPDYRSRLYGREIKTDERPDLFAATPPLESLRYVLSLCASAQSQTDPHRILTIDVKKRAYALVCTPIFIELRVEDRLPRRVLWLNLTCPCTAPGTQRRIRLASTPVHRPR